jgi:NAD(P)-dependent dehydrogenase (short-subunit alcohol dehydrogenase family)
MSTLSVIIPALNEERHIGALLSDVASQTRRPDEVLIVDAGSADGTIAEARRFPFAKLLEGEPPVARGRNLGGRSAVGDVLVFLDADTRLPARFFEDFLTDFEHRRLDVACPLYVPHDSTPVIEGFHALFNLLTRAFQKKLPSGAGHCLAVRREVFRESSGFDPSLKFDDIELIRRLSKGRRFGVVEERVLVSDRRYREHGNPRMMLRYALMALIFALGKFAWANRIDYGFGDHKTLRGEMAPAPKLKPVEQQVVALMGASSGIGRETALRFAERGARVVVSARSEEGLRSLVEEIRHAGGEATAIPADVTDFEQVEGVASRAAEAYGRLDTWVHLAAVSIFAPFAQTTPEEFSRVVEIDLMGQAYGAMAALPHIKREGQGALVHVTSVVARRSVPLQGAYCAAKHGVDGLLDTLRVELRREGWPIGVTNVMPAAINTPFFDKARTRLGVKPKGFPPLYAPGVVADAILYAAEKAPREIVAGGAGKGMILGQRLSPRLMDTVMLRGGFGSQLTDEPKSADDPDALFEPVQDQNRTDGDFGSQTLGRSLVTWLDTHPKLKGAAIAGTALGAAVLMRARS